MPHIYIARMNEHQERVYDSLADYVFYNDKMTALIQLLIQQEGNPLWAGTMWDRVTLSASKDPTTSMWVSIETATDGGYNLLYPWMKPTPPPWREAFITAHFTEVNELIARVLDLVYQPLPSRGLRIAAWMEEGSIDMPTVEGMLTIPIAKTPMALRSDITHLSLLQYCTTLLRNPHPQLQSIAETLLPLLPLFELCGLGANYTATFKDHYFHIKPAQASLESQRSVIIAPYTSAYHISYPDDTPDGYGERHGVSAVINIDDTLVALRMILVALQRTFPSTNVGQ